MIPVPVGDCPEEIVPSVELAPSVEVESSEEVASSEEPDSSVSVDSDGADGPDPVLSACSAASMDVTGEDP